MTKSANQLYKEEQAKGCTLTFKEWISREKKKNFYNFTGQQNIPVNQPLNDSLTKTLDELHRSQGYQDSSSQSKYFIGLNKKILIGVVAVAVIGISVFVVYKSRHNLKK